MSARKSPPAESAPDASRTIGDRWLSVGLLVAANLWPLAGVLFLHWTVFSVVLLFWAENVVVGALNVVRILWAKPDDGASWGQKLFLIPFFVVHYGMFTFVHGMFVLILFGGGMAQGADFPALGSFRDAIYREDLALPVITLFVSHAVSFAWNYVGSGEYRRTDPRSLMHQPYGRVVVLHLVILGGGFLVLALGSPMVPLALLVVLKIGVDLAAHVREHGGRAALGARLVTRRARPRG